MGRRPGAPKAQSLASPGQRPGNSFTKPFASPERASPFSAPIPAGVQDGDEMSRFPRGSLIGKSDMRRVTPLQGGCVGMERFSQGAALGWRVVAPSARGLAGANAAPARARMLAAPPLLADLEGRLLDLLHLRPLAGGRRLKNSVADVLRFQSFPKGRTCGFAGG